MVLQTKKNAQMATIIKEGRGLYLFKIYRTKQPCVIPDKISRITAEK